MLTSIIFTLFFNNILFFIENHQGLKVPKTIVYIWGICSMILSGLCIFFLSGQISIPIALSVLITGVVGTIINLTVQENLELQKVYTKNLLVIFLFFFYSVVQIIPILIFNIDLEKASLETQCYLTLFSQICLIVGLIFIYRKELKKEFQIFWKDKMKNLDTGIRYWVIGFIVMYVSNLIITLLLPKAVAGNEETVRSLITASPWISLISTGFFAPFIEEITFRKAFRNMISNDKLFIWLSGLIFGALHIVFSFSSIYDIAYLIPYCSLGISFGYMYVKTKTVFTSIAMHTAHNFFATLVIISMMVILC